MPSGEKKFRPKGAEDDSLSSGADDNVQPREELPLEGDRKLMRLVAEGDSVAQRTVVTRLMGRLKGVCQTLIHDAADAEDTVQVSLLQVLRAASTYRGDGSLEGWADRITIRNAMRTVSARQRSIARTAEDVELEEVAAPPADTDATEGTPRTVDTYLQTLPETTRSVLTLRHQLGYSVREIAELTEVSPNTVKDRLLRGREQLRRLVRRDRTTGARVRDAAVPTRDDQASMGKRR